jgi:hypothetical protein
MAAVRLLLAVVALTACSPSPPAPATPGTVLPPTPSSSPLDALEQRLTSARTFRLHARLASGGRIESHFDGTLVAGPERRMRLTMQGALGNKDVDATFLCDGSKMGGGARGQPFAMDAAPGVREGIAVALVRLGLLHDVARLSSGLPPDFLDGRAREHLEVTGLTQRPGPDLRGAPTLELSYAVSVDGHRAAEETLLLDQRTGLPLKRRVIVHFPEGDMDVGEEYDAMSVDEPEDDAMFRLAP